jgi:predicted protein tyrosine phosphatase
VGFDWEAGNLAVPLRHVVEAAVLRWNPWQGRLEVRGNPDSDGADRAGLGEADCCCMTKILFICGKNRRRSPSAEEIFAAIDGIKVSSAGTSVESTCQVSADLVEWADWIFVMEPSQRRHLNAHFAHGLKKKKIVCLNIPDKYGYMQPELVTVLRAKVLPQLRGLKCSKDLNSI